MAATTQIVAALVKPTTAPRAWRIVPAPMNPTPVTICAATRVVSVPGVGFIVCRGQHREREVRVEYRSDADENVGAQAGRLAAQLALEPDRAAEQRGETELQHQ